jgi:hypothetical protein
MMRKVGAFQSLFVRHINKYHRDAITGEDLCALLIREHAFVSGSVILAILHGRINYDDIDIYVVNTGPLWELINDEEQIVVNQIVPQPLSKQIECLGFVQIAAGNTTEYTGRLSIKYKKAGTILNLIYTPLARSPIDLVCESFDITSCCNVFDGRELTLGYPLHAIFKIYEYRNWGYIARMRQRILKYYERGFIRIRDPSNENSFDGMIKKHEEKIMKMLTEISISV